MEQNWYAINSHPYYEAVFDAQLPGSERVRVLLKMISQNWIQLGLGSNQTWIKQLQAFVENI